jgi:hypothetical protein
MTGSRTEQFVNMGPTMPVPLITYEMITALYGAPFARAWFRPVSIVKR